jgi:hypothetical protein
VESVQVGGVIVPTTGGVGVGGWEGITTLPDGGDVQPVISSTVNVYVPSGRLAIVVLVPVPVYVVPPGVLLMVHVPDDGKPLRTTLPVETVQVGGVMVPITGAEGGARTVTVVEADGDGPPHPLAVTLIVATPVNEGDHVTVPVVPVPEIELPEPVTDQL